MLTQHEFYVYHQGERVFARRGTEPPVLARTCDTPQDAADLVQSVVNPKGLRHDDPSLTVVTEDAQGKKHKTPLGFHHPDFQAAISGNCREFVEAAYAAAVTED